MVDGLFSVLESAVARYTITGRSPDRSAGRTPRSPPSRPSGPRIPGSSWRPETTSLWAKLCRILGREELIDDPRFETNHLRTENQPALSGILTAELMRKTTAEWIEIFEKAEIPHSRINDIRQICEDPIIRHREHARHARPARRRTRPGRGLPDPPFGDPGRVVAPAPRLGEHSAEVLRTVLGYDKARIEVLQAEGVSRSLRV